MDAGESKPAVSTETTFERVVDLLNDAALETNTEKKVEQLRQVQELIVHKEPNLLDNFLDEMLAFQSDQEAEVRKLIAGFIEDALQSDEESIPKVLTSLMMLLSDDAVSVSKRAILTAGTVYAKTFKWIATDKHQVSDIQRECWDFVNKMKKNIYDRLESANEGIKAHVIRYIESVIMCLSRPLPTPEPIASDSTAQEEPTLTSLSIDIVPEQHPLLKIKKLEDDGRRLFETLVHITSSESVSSQSLMAVMTSVASVATQRPAFMLAAVELLEALHVDLPPKLAKSQVSSVRKCLKMQLIRLAKRHSDFSGELAHRIGTLLSDLGATQAEVLKLMPKQASAGQASGGGSASKRKLGQLSSEGPDVKLARQPVTIPLVQTGADEDEDDDEDDSRATGKESVTYVDKLADELAPKLTLANVTDLVLLEMAQLPDSMPPAFLATYTPISAAGTPAQIQHMARLLSAQVLQSAVGRAYISHAGGTAAEADEAEKQAISTVIGGALATAKQEVPVELPKLGQRQPHRQVRHYKLADVTPSSVSAEELRAASLSCMRRTLSAEQNMSKTKLHGAWVKLVSCLAATFGADYKTALFDFVCEDLRGRFDLCVSWLTHEYAVGRGYMATLGDGGEGGELGVYDEWLTRVLVAVYERTSAKLGLFGQLLLQAPCLTPGALQVLRAYCQDENCSYLGMSVLCELATDRPAERARLLALLLDFSLHDRPEVRANALRELRKLYTRFEDETRATIEEFAVGSLRWLAQATPPEALGAAEWSDELLRTATALFLTLVPVAPGLLPTLADAYATAQPELRKPLLKLLDQPVKQMGMESEALLDFISSCPAGAETLVARLVHVLTADGQHAPSPELVARVYALYQTRVDDVRFLIPVIPGLSKKQVLSILPDVIKLSPVVVKEVLSRIIGKAGQPGVCSPAELLVELHSLDAARADLKQVIKTVNVLLGDRSSFTQEVMAVVLQQLIDVTPLPVLLMRTLLQSLAMYPRLIGLSMNIMHRLIQKQVWKHARLWDGFVRCCQQTKPRSFEVLLQLPVPQLASVFQAAPDLRAPLRDHVRALPDSQLAAIPNATLAELQAEPAQQQPPPEAS